MPIDFYDDFDSMSGDFNDDFSSLTDMELLYLIARASQNPQGAEMVKKAKAAFGHRGYGNYIWRVYRVIREHLVTPFSPDELVPLIFINVTKKASDLPRPRQILGGTKERRTINHWLRPRICETILTQSSDKELMAQMAQRNEGGVAQQSFAEKARWELQGRYEDTVRKYCRALVRGTFDESMAHDLTGDTFDRAFEKAHTYCDNSTRSPEESRRLMKAWLNRIGRNLYIDMLRKFNVKNLVDFDILEAREALVWQCKAWSDFATYDAESASTDKDKHLACMKQAFDGVLTARERDILIAENDFYYNEQERLAAIHAIVEVYGIKDDNRRKISSRARRKMDDHRAAHCEVCRHRVRRKRLGGSANE